MLRMLESALILLQVETLAYLMLASSPQRPGLACRLCVFVRPPLLFSKNLYREAHASLSFVRPRYERSRFRLPASRYVPLPRLTLKGRLSLEWNLIRHC